MENNMLGEETKHLHPSMNPDNLLKARPMSGNPKLFVCCEHEILEFELKGKQTVGRPVENYVPDIPIINKYVSRQHGYFETYGTSVTYTAGETVNPTVFRRKILRPNETVDLWDGDELIISTAGNDEEDVDIMLVFALAPNRIHIWQEMILASLDGLTGLPGRNAFQTWYMQNIFWKDKEDVCLFMIDIDHFKQINDTYGHSAGDNALKLVSDRLTAITKDTGGFVSRWGGDEFVGIIRAKSSRTYLLLENLKNEIGMIRIDDRFTVTLSIGFLDFGKLSGKKDIEELISMTDKALYEAKAQGRDCLCECLPEKVFEGEEA